MNHENGCPIVAASRNDTRKTQRLRRFSEGVSYSHSLTKKLTWLELFNITKKKYRWCLYCVYSLICWLAFCRIVATGKTDQLHQLASIVPRLLRYFQSIFKIMYGELDAHHKKITEKNAGEKSKLMLTAHMSYYFSSKNAINVLYCKWWWKWRNTR